MPKVRKNEKSIIDILLAYWDRLFFSNPTTAYQFVINPENQEKLEFSFFGSYDTFLKIYEQARKVKLAIAVQDILNDDEIKLQLADALILLKQGILNAVKAGDYNLLDISSKYFYSFSEKLVSSNSLVNSTISQVFDLNTILNLLIPNAKVFDHIKFLFERLSSMSNRLIITMPPQHGKTTTVLAFLFRYLTERDNRNVAYVSYSYTNTQNRILPLKRALERCKLQDPAGWRRDVLRLKNGSVLFPTSVDGTLTGEHLDLVVIDDPIKNYSEAISKARRDAVYNFYANVVLTRGFADLKVVIVGTRWHKDDLIGRLINDSEFELIELPALARSDDVLNRAPNTPLCEFFASYKHLEKIKSLYPDVFETQYQCTPRSLLDTLFVNEPVFYTELPENTIISIGVDLAFTEKETSDYTAVVVLAIEPTNNYYYLLEAHRWRDKINTTIAKLRWFYEKYKVPLNVESVGGQIAIIDLLKKEGIVVRPIKPVSDKVSRALNFANAWNTNRFFIRQGSAPVVDEYISEVLNFTGKGDAHDDFVDATVYAMAVPTTSINIL